MSLTNDQNEPGNTSSSFYTEEDELFDYIHNLEDDKINEMLSKKVLPIWDYKSKENQNSTVLNISVFKKSLKITQILIDYCKDKKPEKVKEFINTPNDQGVTPLHYASFRGEVQIIKLLIENGADITKLTNRQLNVIHYSAQGNKPNSLMFFYLLFKENKDLENNSNLILEKDGGGSTSLHWAVYSLAEDYLLFLLNLDIFDSFIKKQNFVNQLDNQGYSALHLSVSSKSPRIAMKLLQNGANPSLVDKDGLTPLQLAIEKKQYEIINILKNTESCQCCNIKAPMKQEKKSIKNIILIFFVQIISSIIFCWWIFPIFLNYYNNLLFFVYIFLFFLFFLIYIILLNKNPGIKPKKDLEFLKRLIDDNKDLTRYCYKCFIRKTRHSKHCIICDNCYDKFDHHCFWINKCVAKKNYCWFFIFLFESVFYLIYIVCISIINLSKIIGLIISDDEYSINEFCEGFYITNFFLNLCERSFDDKLIIPLTINSILILAILSFLIPEFLLLILHIHVCCSNYKRKKYRTTTASTLSSASLMNANDSFISDN